MLSGTILDIGGMGAFFRALSLKKKRAYSLFAPPKQVSFLPTSNKIIYFKTQGPKLGAIVAPNKGLE